MSHHHAPTEPPQRATVPPAGLFAAVRDAGVDAVSLARRIGLSAPERLADPQPALSEPERAAFFDALFGADEPPDLALRLGAAAQPELMGLIGLVALTAPDHGAALARCARYKRLSTDLRVDVHRTASSLVVSVDPPEPDRASSHGQVDAELAFLVSFGRRFVSPAVEPLRVRLTRPARGRRASYEAFFGCPLDFGAARGELRIRAEHARRPLLSASEDAHGLLAMTADRRLAAFDEAEDLVAATKTTIETHLAEGAPSIDDVAARHGTSARSLQRHLAERGTTFSELLDQTRHTLAVQHLRVGRFDLDAIAFLLGYANVNSFARAFRRWTGESPGAFRRREGSR